MSAPSQQVVITGAGLICCLGADADTAWEAVAAGRCGIAPLTLIEAADGTPRSGGQAPDPPAGLLDGEARETRLLRQAVDQALAQARLRGLPWPCPPTRCAAVFGTTLHGMRRAGEFLRGRPDALASFLAAPVLVRALRGLPIAGPALTTCSACSSGLGSVALGITLLKTGQADLVIAGGYDPVSEYAYAGFNSLRLVAENALRPFCAGRDGMKLSEGYGAVVLERAPDAARRGAPIIARVLGFGESADAHHLTQPHPEGHGAVRALRSALASAGIEPNEIGLIAAHATGTANNDGAEFAAYSAVFGEGLPRIPAVAFKSHIGHCLGGAGAAELILSAAALRTQVAPPTANVSAEAIEFRALDLVHGAARPAKIEHTLNTSLGFGGANTCVVLGNAGARAAPRPPADGNGAPALRPVLITGVGVILPGLIGNDAFTARLADRGAPPVRADTGGIPDDQVLPLLNARRLRRVSDYSKLTLGAAALAFRDAGIADGPAFGERCSAILGTMIGSTGYCEAYYRQIVTEGMGAANPMLFAEGVPNAASAQLSMMLGIKGACQTIIGSRTAGLDALGLAWLRIASGLWERAVVGAAEEYSAVVNQAMQACGLYSGSGAGLPFTGDRGFAVGAGAVALVLESAASAQERGGRARGRVLAYAASLNGGEDEAARAGAVSAALSRAGVADLVVSSASGCRLDRIESAGIARAARRADAPTVSSVVGHTAETFSVSPLAGLAGVLLSGRAVRLVSPEADLPGLRPAAGDEEVREATVLCTDVAGPCSAVRVGVGATAP